MNGGPVQWNAYNKGLIKREHNDQLDRHELGKRSPTGKFLLG